MEMGDGGDCGGAGGCCGRVVEEGIIMVVEMMKMQVVVLF